MILKISNMVAVNNNVSVVLKTIMFIMNQSSIQDTSSYNYYFMDIGKETNATKCYGIYGCFGLSKPWTSEHRPVSLFPNDIEVIEPHYSFYTRKKSTTPTYFDLNDDEIIPVEEFNPEKPIYVISHGYMEGGAITWIHDMKNEFLYLEDCSVIVVDWHGGSSPPYTQAVANIRLVGAMTAHLLAEIAHYTGDLGLDHVHCIGHSLGAHMCGYTGYTLQKDFSLKLGRITGMDPAEPHFAKAKPPVRLDRTAAKYVDVIHTDASQFMRGGLGINERIGHVDYFPNGGTNQPGCSRTVMEYVKEADGSFFQGVKKYLACNHMRSYQFFTESINSKCAFTSVACSSYQDFLNGNCFNCGQYGEKCLRFGHHGRRHYNQLLKRNAIKPDKNLEQYFITGDSKPFCRAHYRIIVNISNSEKSQEHKGEVGQLVLTLHSTSDGKGYKTAPVTLKSGYHEPGKSYVIVVATDEIKHIRAVQVEWSYNSSILNPLTWRILATPRIFVDKIVVEALEINERITVCPKNDIPFISGLPQILIPAYC